MASQFINPGVMDPTNPEAIQIMQRQKMAEQLMAQGQEPLNGQMVSGHFVAPSWTQQLAKGLNTYMGAKGMREATEAQQALAQKLRDQRQSEMGQLTQLFQGRPADQLPADQQGPVRSAQGPDIAGAYNFAAASQNPQLQQFGMQGLAQMPVMAAQKAAREEDRAFRQQESEANRAARMEELNLRMQDGQRSQQERLQAQKELREMQIQASKDNARLVASMRQPPQAQIIQTETGPMQLVGGKAVPILGPDNKPVAGKPTAAGAKLGSKEQDARDALSTIDMAEKLLDSATGSGIGSALDTTAAFFGKSTPGAQAGAQLKALEGDLVAKMPKMSGPQSDKDVLLYRQMAGQIGDPGVPADTKRAALTSIREMQNRYAGVRPEATPTNQPKPLKRLKFDAQGNLVP